MMSQNPNKRNDQMSITIETELSPIVHLLGDLLGEVIKEQVGEQGFQVVEHIRLISKNIRELGDENAEKELMDYIESLLPHQRHIVIKAFSIYFQLNNLAEEWYNSRKNKQWEASQNDPRTDTFRAVIQMAKQQNVNITELMSLLEKIGMKPVWTAHPTEARRLTTLITLHEIFEIIAKQRTEMLSPNEKKIITSRLKEKITMLWQSDDFRHLKPTVLDEVRSVLYYFDTSVIDIIPDIYKSLKMHIITEYQDELDPKMIIDLPIFLHFGSWVGGDRDGHPGVTSTVTIQSLLLHKRTILRKYLAKISELLKDFSMSLNNITISDKLQESIEDDEKSFPEFAEISRKLNAQEPYRRKLDFIRLKLENTLEKVEEHAEQVGLGRTLVGRKNTTTSQEIRTFYRSSTEFLEDLHVIRDSLVQNNGKVIAEGKLEDLIMQARVFRFYLAALDIRQDSGVHEDAMDEIFQHVGLPSLYQLNESEKTKLLLTELNNPRPLGVNQFLEDLSPMTQEVIRTLQVINDALHYIDNNCIHSYIISMCRTVNDILILMLLMKETKLIEIEKGRVTKAAIDLVPLFETKADLERAPLVMESLFTNNLYASFLHQRNDTQEIMVGYSDSGKDVGYFESHYRIIKAQLQLREVARRHQVKLRIFHGRGGTISRGGGPTNKALLSQPRELVTDVKVTEQGEVIAANYGNPLIARRYLEQIASAVIQRTIEDYVLFPSTNVINQGVDPIDPSEEVLQQFSELASLAREKYESLVKKHPHFIEFFLTFTPIDLIERATIGSRPSRRKKTSIKDITSLRAIPWVFSWMQCRLLVPAFFGVGTALETLQKRQKFDSVQKIFHEWQYFETMIDNLHMVLLKTDLITTRRYLRLVANQEHLTQLYNNIVSEYHRTRKFVLDLTNCKELLEKSPDLQQSIRRRNPYLDPLNACQVILLKEWREKGRSEELHPTSPLRALFQTVNGIAAGMRNTG